MFKNKEFRRVISSVVFVATLSSVSVSSYAMQPSGSGGGTGSSALSPQNILLLVRVLYLAFQNAPAAWQQMIQENPEVASQLAQTTVPQPQVQQPSTPPRQGPVSRVVMRTPDGHKRAPAAAKQEEKVNFFISPNSKNGRNVIYVQLPEHIDFQPKIDLKGRSISKVEFSRKLQQHPKYNALKSVKDRDLPRYGGKAVSNRGCYTSYTRFCSEAREAVKGGMSRHARGIRECTLIHQNIFENIDPEQEFELEGWLIEEIDANYGNGLNSNAGSHKRKRDDTDLDDDSEDDTADSNEGCRPISKKLRYDDPDSDDSDDGETDTNSSQETNSSDAIEISAS